MILDDGTALYIIEARKCFEDLRQVASQLAGLLVLAAAGADSAAPDHPLVATAGQLHQVSLDGLYETRPTERAREHHHYLLRAAGSIGEALAAAQRGREIDPILIPLRSAYLHLQRVSQLLPGFEMVNFEQGCCAGRAAL